MHGIGINIGSTVRGSAASAKLTPNVTGHNLSGLATSMKKTPRVISA